MGKKWQEDDDDDFEADSGDDFVDEEDDEDDEFLLDPTEEQDPEQELEELEEEEEEDVQFQISARELEQDLDTMFQERGEVLSIWPLITVVDLDRKLPLKLKRHEFEPIPDGMLGNISCFDHRKVNRLEDIDETIEPTVEESWFLGVIAESHEIDLGILKVEYIGIKETLLKEVELDPTFKITLPILKGLSPKTSGVVLVDIMNVFEKLKIFEELKNISVLLKKYGKDWIYNPVTTTTRKIWHCRTCQKYCLHHRYSLIRDPSFVICVKCFELGQFPFEYSSALFECLFGATDDEDKVKSYPEWTEEETLKLLEVIEVTSDWKIISEKMDRPKHECQFHFSQLPIDYFEKYDVHDKLAVLTQLLGVARNPVSSLIYTVAFGAHPGLAAEIARLSMLQLTKLTPAELGNQDMLWKVAKESFVGCLEKANKLIEIEDSLLKRYIEFLIVSLTKRISLKVDFYDSLINGSSGNTSYHDLITNYIYDTRDDE